MFSFIEKSGTGIEKSGTGIEKSGTGIEKSGTGIGRWHLAALIVLASFALQVIAAEPQVMVSQGDEQLLVSVHSADGILVGRAGAVGETGYFRVALYSAVGPAGSGASLEPLVAGSGSGSSKEVAGSGSGSSTEVAGSGSGSSTEVAGSGSGSATEVAGSGSGSAGALCPTAPGLLVAGSGSGSSKEVAGSGSGSSTEVAGSGSGSSKEVAGSGSGSAGDGFGCASLRDAWGVAEVVIDRSGAHVVVHQLSGSRAEEYLVAFLPGSISGFAHSLNRGSSDQGFIAVP